MSPFVSGCSYFPVCVSLLSMENILFLISLLGCP